jgi:hypothetical protein
MEIRHMEIRHMEILHDEREEGDVGDELMD